ncbi:Rrf2 family transcriptional regulator [Rhizobium sp. RM]|uniref:RrF2 family transcriptional regulator n=1 Tax=Rhizobium sp. RM TaxID=2748079 RepID=UPI00110F64D0|nr:Rrf2 family transcriptional regulator [Rhizobium sp. RM]NWJ25527.1 Rrf2 family transcriptional regulator [Rhizobium sp. RM]TMV22158.1 Rrf2 family transcriptional regulator [Rhizobium sp. Td3]
MRLKRESEVAIAILAACANAKGGQIRTVEAARAAGTTASFAAQVVPSLVQAGLIEARRGRRGGLALTQPAGDILLGDVIARMQPELIASARTEENLTGRDPTAELCKIVMGADDVIRAYLDRFSIADLANKNRPGPLQQDRRKKGSDHKTYSAKTSLPDEICR